MLVYSLAVCRGSLIIYVTLDVNAEALTEAIALGADFITHHPFIFKPLTAIRTDRKRPLDSAGTAGRYPYLRCAHKFRSCLWRS